MCELTILFPQSWAEGPYVQLLPAAAEVDVCYVSLPGRSEVDVQISAEYVARGVHWLAPQSATGMVSIIGHSQGAGINPQWALQFYPSIQPLVANYIALAGEEASFPPEGTVTRKNANPSTLPGDFHGSLEIRATCNPTLAGLAQ